MVNIKNKAPRDENGQQHGEWVIHWDNGRLWYRCNYIHGVEHGFDETYFSDGRLKYRGYWNMGRRVGYWVIGRRIEKKKWGVKKSYYLWLL